MNQKKHQDFVWKLIKGFNKKNSIYVCAGVFAAACENPAGFRDVELKLKKLFVCLIFSLFTHEIF